MKEEVKPFKIRVTPEQSEIVQKELFGRGYSWYMIISKEISNQKEPFLFFEDFLTCSNNENRFNDRRLQEITFNEFKQLYMKEEKTFPRKMLVWDDHESNSKELLVLGIFPERITSLKVICIDTAYMFAKELPEVNPKKQELINKANELKAKADELLKSAEEL